jgi:hypothetical protein
LPTAYDNVVFEALKKYDHLKFDSESHPNLFAWNNLVGFFRPLMQLGWSDARSIKIENELCDAIEKVIESIKQESAEEADERREK